MKSQVVKLHFGKLIKVFN